MIETERQPDVNDLRKFGLIFGGIIYGIFGALLPVLSNSVAVLMENPKLIPMWPWLLGVIIQILAVVHPGSLRRLQTLWLFFAAIAGWINTRIILILLFYLMILPIGLIMRILGKDPMRRNMDTDAKSYRIPVTPRQPEHMRNPY
ncbi:MAG: hypothetical protein GWP58_14395 [Gammaproteobacteria bacterium]|jgi:hypothetical protein|nr:hypothetical protein [Gammaproteobacteria bacterium]